MENQEPFFCVHCGKSLSGEIRFCPYCGASVNEIAQEEQELDVINQVVEEETKKYNVVMTDYKLCAAKTLMEILKIDAKEAFNACAKTPSVVVADVSEEEANNIVLKLQKEGVHATAELVEKTDGVVVETFIEPEKVENSIEETKIKIKKQNFKKATILQIVSQVMLVVLAILFITLPLFVRSYYKEIDGVSTKVTEGFSIIKYVIILIKNVFSGEFVFGFYTILYVLLLVDLVTVVTIPFGAIKDIIKKAKELSKINEKYEEQAKINNNAVIKQLQRYVKSYSVSQVAGQVLMGIVCMSILTSFSISIPTIIIFGLLLVGTFILEKIAKTIKDKSLK